MLKLDVYSASKESYGEGTQLQSCMSGSRIGFCLEAEMLESVFGQYCQSRGARARQWTYTLRRKQLADQPYQRSWNYRVDATKKKK